MRKPDQRCPWVRKQAVNKHTRVTGGRSWGDPCLHGSVHFLVLSVLSLAAAPSTWHQFPFSTASLAPDCRPAHEAVPEPAVRVEMSRSSQGQFLASRQKAPGSGLPEGQAPRLGRPKPHTLPASTAPSELYHETGNCRLPRPARAAVQDQAQHPGSALNDDQCLAQEVSNRQTLKDGARPRRAPSMVAGWTRTATSPLAWRGDQERTELPPVPLLVGRHSSSFSQSQCPGIGCCVRWA